MASDVWEEVVLDQGLAGIIRPAVRKAFTSASMDNSTLDLELLDLAVEKCESLFRISLWCLPACNSSGQLVILASYAGIEEAIAVDMVGIRRIYTLIRLSYAADTIKVESVVSVPYQSVCTLPTHLHQTHL
jgi:nuclear pore complex protein Nup133